MMLSVLLLVPFVPTVAAEEACVTDGTPVAVLGVCQDSQQSESGTEECNSTSESDSTREGRDTLRVKRLVARVTVDHWCSDDEDYGEYTQVTVVQGMHGLFVKQESGVDHNGREYCSITAGGYNRLDPVGQHQTACPVENEPPLTWWPSHVYSHLP